MAFSGFLATQTTKVSTQPYFIYRGVGAIIFACSKTKLLRNPEIPYLPPLVYTHITYSHT